MSRYQQVSLKFSVSSDGIEFTMPYYIGGVEVDTQAFRMTASEAREFSRKLARLADTLDFEEIPRGDHLGEIAVEALDNPGGIGVGPDLEGILIEDFEDATDFFEDSSDFGLAYGRFRRHDTSHGWPAQTGRAASPHIA